MIISLPFYLCVYHSMQLWNYVKCCYDGVVQASLISTVKSTCQWELTVSSKLDHTMLEHLPEAADSCGRRWMKSLKKMQAAVSKVLWWPQGLPHIGQLNDGFYLSLTYWLGVYRWLSKNVGSGNSCIFQF